MNSLSKRDLDILEFYADHGNRERYWNYLAQHPGNDGYGLLALGVVRNDNMPGAVANIYAQNYAEKHDHKALSERGWEAFGIDLMQNDFVLRKAHVDRQQYALALNLPASDVRQAHLTSFNHAQIGIDAWTPNKLLEAAGRHGGVPEMEKVWHQMLDNDLLGLDRSVNTLAGLAYSYNDRQLGALAYTKDLGIAYAEAAQSRPASDPDTIGTQSFYYAYNAHSRGWDMVIETPARGAMEMMSQPERLVRPITDPQTLTSLDDARAVRMERNAKVARIAPGDPYVTLARSPFVLAGTSSSQAPAEAPLAMQTPDALTPSVRDLHATLKQRFPDASSDRLMQFTAACYTNRIGAGNLSTIHLDEASMQITFAGSSCMATPVSIDLNTQPPQSQQSIEHMQQHDRQQAQMMNQMQAKSIQVNQQSPMLVGS